MWVRQVSRVMNIAPEPNLMPSDATIGFATAPRPGPLDEVRDRRRPGRTDSVSAHLLPLLRADAAAAPFEQAKPADSLSPMKGLLFSVVLSGVLWFLIFRALALL